MNKRIENFLKAATVVVGGALSACGAPQKKPSHNPPPVAIAADPVEDDRLSCKEKLYAYLAGKDPDGVFTVKTEIDPQGLGDGQAVLDNINNSFAARHRGRSPVKTVTQSTIEQNLDVSACLGWTQPGDMDGTLMPGDERNPTLPDAIGRVKFLIDHDFELEEPNFDFIVSSAIDALNIGQIPTIDGDVEELFLLVEHRMPELISRIQEGLLAQGNYSLRYLTPEEVEGYGNRLYQNRGDNSYMALINRDGSIKEILHISRYSGIFSSAL
jgi:hypothetical protein